MSLSPAEVAAVLADPTKKVDNLVGLGGSPGFVGTAMGGLFNSGGGLSKSQGFDQDDRDAFSNLGGSFRPGGQASAISAVLGATGATESAVGKAAIDRLQNAMDRKACNESGGFYTMGGACLVGEAAEEQVNKILENPDAPSVLKARADAYVERNDENNDGTISFEEADNIEDVVLSAAVNVINTIDELNAIGDSTQDDTTQDDFQTTSTQEIVSAEDGLTADQIGVLDDARVAGANIYTGQFGIPNIVFTGVEAGGSSASDSANAAVDAAANAEDANAADASASDSASGDSSATESKDVTASAGLPGADIPDGGGAGSQTETGSSGGVQTKSTGEGSDIIWTENNPWENNPEGTFGGFILVKQDGTWGESGTTTVQIEGTGVVIDIDWENGTYTSDYVFGNEDDKDKDKGIDTSQTETPNNTPTGNTTPVVTTGAGTTTSGGGMFSIPDITDIISQIVINNTIGTPNNNVAGSATTNNQVDASTTTTNTVNNTTVDPNAGRASFDDFPVDSVVDQSTATNTDPNAGRASFDDFPSNGGNGGNGVDGVDGGSDGDGDFPAAGTYAGGYCAAGETLVQKFHDGTGGTYETRTPNSPTCVRKSTTPNGTDAIDTGGNGGGKGTGQGSGDGPGDGDGREPEPEPEPIQQMASPSMPSTSFTADGEINYQDPRKVSIIEPAALGLLGGLASNAMDGSADLIGRLSFSSQQPQQSQQGFNQLQGFDQLQGLSNLSMFDNVLRRNYIA